MAYIEIKDLCKSYTDQNGECVQVLEDITLNVQRGEFISIFGPNGCGKTTLLNVIAGLIDFERGMVKIGGKGPDESKIGFVFQQYIESLFPWLKNIDNIAFSLDSSRRKQERHKYIERYVTEMGLEQLPLYKYPYQCSAGQQQLVALVRELIYEPDVLLMDEPFVSLDYDQRISQQQHLLNSWERTNTTVLFVSHEIDEAIYLSDRLILLSQRPAEVLASYEITLPRPRRVAMLGEEAFFNLKVPILREFMKMIGK